MGEYNRESETVHSCVDCGVTNCNKMDRFYPEFCLTTDMDERLLGEVIRLYGIATCVGLIRETRKLTDILRYHGFEVYGVACKAGIVRKTEVGIPKTCENTGVNMCNPILQAKILNAEHTDLNIVMGLCVGHDSLFYKYSEGLTTTLVVKDRVLGHNPVAALYAADGYYHGKLYPEK